MREIKFRFWCKEHKFVDAGFDSPIQEVHFNQRGELGRWCPKCIKARPMTLMQYTGLKDKNGVEIYEGDIVRVTGFKDLIAVIEFAGASFVNAFYGDCLPLIGTEEVIGNIYEESELLSQKGYSQKQ